jgi:hypothetical protein
MTQPRRRMFWPVFAVLTLLVIGGCGLLAFTTCNPSDRVEVDVRNIPSDIWHLSLAADTPDGPASLIWSWTYLLPAEKHPADRNGIYGDPPHMQTIGSSVRWRTGERYGVVMQTKTGEWRVAWFPAAEVPLQGRTPLGGGKVEFDLSKAEIVPLDADTVKALGLQDVKPQK